MSKVLYREYRPRSLDDVKGQDHIVNALKNALKNDSIAHAYLFTGSHGVGKTSVARILAHLINDIEYNEEDNHLDIIEIDAASNRRIDEIRELREKAFIAPTSAKYKVYIIDEVHMLTREAFNALLKTLEEPPEHAIFILATTEAHKVPHTIISRTQRFSFKPQDTASLESRLSYVAKKEGIKIEDAALQVIARHSHGSFRDAISTLDQIRHVADSKVKNISEDDVASIIGVPSKELLQTLVGSLFTSDSAALFKATDTLRQQGISAVVVSQELLRDLREQLSQKSPHTEAIVGAMKFLLQHMNTATYDTVEVALLQHMKHSSDQHVTEQKQQTEANIVTTEEPPKKVQQETPEEQKEPEKVPPKQPVQQHEEPKQTSAKTSDVSWQDVLEALRGHHNTLYGVLKMSTATIQDTILKLEFKFPFHEKQFLQSKHTSILKNVLKEKTSKDFEITTSVNSQKTQATDQLIASNSPSEKKDDLHNISNIFSGAELLE